MLCIKQINHTCDCCAILHIKLTLLTWSIGIMLITQYNHISPSYERAMVDLLWILQKTWQCFNGIVLYHTNVLITCWKLTWITWFSWKTECCQRLFRCCDIADTPRENPAPCLLTWFNFNSSMGAKLHPLWIMNYGMKLFIHSQT